MAYRCTLGNHGSCTACAKFVSPNLSDHAHIYRGRGRDSDILCETCWLGTAIAAIPILKVAKQIGVKLENPASLRRWVESAIIIGVQTPFDLEGLARN